VGLSTDAVNDPGTRRRITEPLSGAVWLTTCVIVAGIVVPLLLTPVLGGRIAMFGFGQSAACATVTVNGVAGTDQPVGPLKPGASSSLSSAGTVALCAGHPTLAQRFLVLLTQAPTTLLWLAVLVLLWLLVRTVRRNGPFDICVTRRLRFLGWFALAAYLAVQAVQSYAAAAFTATVHLPSADNPGPVPVVADTINGVLSTDWIPLLLVVCGVLTLARIVRIGAQMHDDLAGTV
jgi:hypothetical protein